MSNFHPYWLKNVSRMICAVQNKQENPWMIIVDAKKKFKRRNAILHLYKHTKRQEWMNDLRRLKQAGESEPWNVAGGARGAGPGQVRSSPASLSSLSRRSLSVCVRALLLLLGSSLLPLLPDSFLQRIPYPFSGNRRVKRTNKQFLTYWTFYWAWLRFVAFFPPPLLLLLRFFLWNWVQQIEWARFLCCHLLHHRLCSLFIFSLNFLLGLTSFGSSS